MIDPQPHPDHPQQDASLVSGASRGPFDESPQQLYLDPEVLAQELAEELLGDPLDELDSLEPDGVDGAAECDLGLGLLAGDHEQRVQGLRIFCEHRDPRALPHLLPLLEASCPIERMSAVYALEIGRAHV